MGIFKLPVHIFKSDNHNGHGNDYSKLLNVNVYQSFVGPLPLTNLMKIQFNELPYTKKAVLNFQESYGFMNVLSTLIFQE